MSIKKRPKSDPPVSKSAARQNMISMARRGGITLVLGAGVSIPRGIPNWEYLARAMWKQAFGKTRSPWAGKSSPEITQFLPIVFELVYRELGEQEFIRILKQNLYARASYPGREKNFKAMSESLAVVARTILQEHRRRGERRIDSVITLNADDLIEQAVCAVAGIKTKTQFWKQSVFRSVARSTHFDSGGHTNRRIPIYHIHGFLPSGRLPNQRRYDYMFVFTDAQYWSTSASALTFANRVMSWALSEGRCMFIGLSMTDINLLRWLALRTLERDRDLAEMLRDPRVSPGSVHVMRREFERHSWIRPRSDDPSGFISKFLRLRGIEAVEIKSWPGESFRRLLAECFPP